MPARMSASEGEMFLASSHVCGVARHDAFTVVATLCGNPDYPAVLSALYPLRAAQARSQAVEGPCGNVSRDLLGQPGIL